MPRIISHTFAFWHLVAEMLDPAYGHVRVGLNSELQKKIDILNITNYTKILKPACPSIVS